MMTDEAVSSRSPRTERLEQITIRGADPVPVDQVEAFEAARNYIRLHTLGGARPVIRERISVLAQQLDPVRFVRIHRGTIVNLARIKSVEPWFSGDLIAHMVSGAQFRVSRNFKTALRSRVSA